MSTDKPCHLLPIKMWNVYAILVRCPIIFLMHNYLFLYTIYPLQVQLQVINLNHAEHENFCVGKNIVAVNRK